MKARIVTTKISTDAGRELGFVYEVFDERGFLRWSGWTRGTEKRAREEASDYARNLGLEVE